jgi:signal transduction histidine kinase
VRVRSDDSTVARRRIEVRPREEWSRVAWLSLAGMVLVLVAWTVVTSTSTEARFDLHWATARLALETASFMATLFVASLAYLRYSLTLSRAWLLIGVAFLVLALNQLAFRVLVTPGDFGLNPQSEQYLWTAGQLLGGLVMLIGAVMLWQRVRPRRRLSEAALVTATALIALGVIQAALWGAKSHLPPLASSASLAEFADRTGPLPGLTIINLTLGTIGAALFLAAAIAVLFRRSGTSAMADTLASSDAVDGGLPAWLVPALILASFSQLHYMLFPTTFADVISTGDLLRMAFSVTLVLGLMREVRLAFMAEHDRASALSEAYDGERRRVTELEDMERAKAELFGILTHELMHPVAALQTFAIVVAKRWESLDQSKRQRMVSQVEEEMGRLRNLAEEAITVTQLDTKGFAVAPRPERVTDLVREAAESQIDLDGRLKVHIDCAEETIVLADPSRVLQIFRNLLSNAAKYADPDSPVELTAKPSDGAVVFSVVDHGPGIAEEDVPRLFSLFSRIRPVGKERVSGSGLGLYISKGLAEAHGGTMWVQTEPGKGSSFSFTLPVVWDER